MTFTGRIAALGVLLVLAVSNLVPSPAWGGSDTTHVEFYARASEILAQTPHPRDVTAERWTPELHEQLRNTRTALEKIRFEGPPGRRKKEPEVVFLGDTVTADVAKERYGELSSEWLRSYAEYEEQAYAWATAHRYSLNGVPIPPGTKIDANVDGHWVIATILQDYNEDSARYLVVVDDWYGEHRNQWLTREQLALPGTHTTGPNVRRGAPSEPTRIAPKCDEHRTLSDCMSALRPCTWTGSICADRP